MTITSGIQTCLHDKELKHYKKDDKIICVTCGQVWPQIKVEPSWSPMCPPIDTPLLDPNKCYTTGDPPCMFDNLPDGAYGLVCNCPKHGTYCLNNSSAKI